MKKHNTIIASILVGVLMAISIFNSPSVSASHTPNSLLQTGDTFVFSENSERYNLNSRYFNMVNQTNPGQLLHGDDEYDYEQIFASGNADIGFIRQTANLPTFPHETDTLISVNSETMTQPGSYREGYQNHTESQEGNPPVWINPEGYYEDLSNRGDGHEESIGLMSNSTFAIIFPEMDMTQLNIFGDGGNGGGDGGENDFFNIGGFDGMIPLDNSYQVTGSESFQINGHTETLNTLTVVVSFYGFWDNSSTMDVTFGDQGDPNSPVANLDVYSSLLFNYTMSMVYDSSNGMLLQQTRESSMIVHWDFPTQDRTLEFQNGDDWNATIYQDGIYSQNETSISQIDTASSLYGNTRPSSTADEIRFDDGEYLTYNLEQGNSYNLNIEFRSDDKDNGGFYEASMQSSGYDESSGDLYIDVFRHTANAFEAVIYLDGEGTYHSENSRSENQNGDVHNENPPSQTQNYPVLFFGLIQFGTDADHDILPFFEENMWIETGDDCRDGDDCVNFNFERQLTKDGVVNETSYYINLVEDSEGDDDAYPVINGFTQYEFNVTEHTQKYSVSETSVTQIPIGDGPNRHWVDVDITVNGEGYQSFYYDDDTGAMVAMIQEMDAKAEIHHEGDFSYWDEQSQQQINTTIKVDVVMEFSSRWNMILSSHPHSYNSQPTMPPVSEPPGTTSSDPTDDPTNDESSADLPLPVPYASIIFGIFSAGIIVRRRK